MSSRKRQHDSQAARQIAGETESGREGGREGRASCKTLHTWLLWVRVHLRHRLEPIDRVKQLSCAVKTDRLQNR